MEPAGYRREHHPSLPPRGRISGPQWSPPVIGGSTRILFDWPNGIVVGPQWSPPVIGGSTLIDKKCLELHQMAAMEPAGYRREHVVDDVRPDAGHRAAMEPAGYRREHPACTSPATPSRQSRNGARRLSAGARDRVHPPLVPVPAAAMEPAGYRREHP